MDNTQFSLREFYQISIDKVTMLENQLHRLRLYNSEVRNRNIELLNENVILKGDLRMRKCSEREAFETLENAFDVGYGCRFCDKKFNWLSEFEDHVPECKKLNNW